jgi:hypothetical protein
VVVIWAFLRATLLTAAKRWNAALFATLPALSPLVNLWALSTSTAEFLHPNRVQVRRATRRLVVVDTVIRSRMNVRRVSVLLRPCTKWEALRGKF